MQWETPWFIDLSMNSEIGAYQDDFGDDPFGGDPFSGDPFSGDHRSPPGNAPRRSASRVHEEMAEDVG